ncbi:M28 family peptidase [Lutibacter sp.]|uniref:M28 family peptidase n=1 Tax=Lutibacter sp. TaxID=1925666 RepID=UPI002732B219|nr:M28 family peptidase [Lutibacter sp.]MDP3314152.1 M28 family peptidase [Lutibacter sp.]
MNYQKHFPIISFLLIVGTIFYSFYSLLPSGELKETTDSSQFSTKNALVHVKEMSKEPHYPGTNNHEQVINYIVDQLEKLGLEVEIQEQVAINKKWRAATKTKNIVAKIKGNVEGKALLLLSHYDSNPHSSLGASDAASGVAVILEGVRAFVEKNSTPKNDIIICITDAEELGLLGANAFVNHHPWAKNIGLVLNFEARGSGGPSYMLLETNGGNKKLIEAFQNANTPYPVGNSLMYSIYKMLPNDTDLTVFREDGDIDGFNFAFIGDHFDYHTVQDSFERMNMDSFNHQASYLIASLNYFANSDLTSLKSQEDYVYFNFPFIGMVFYPFSWILPMFILVLFLVFVTITIGFKYKKLTLKGVLNGFVPLLGALILSIIITFFGWKLLLKLYPQYQGILHGFTYNGYYYIAAVVFLTISLCGWFYATYLKKYSSQDLSIAPLILWILINGLVVFYLPGAAFFIVPVLILLSIIIILFFSNKKHNRLLFSFLSIPVILIFAPMVVLFPVGLGLKMVAISAFFVVLLVGFLLPVFYQKMNLKKLAVLFLLIGVGFLTKAHLESSYTINQKQPNSILYVLDANKNEAFWASYNLTTDDFTKQFLGENPVAGSYDANTTKSKYQTRIQWHLQTAIKNLEKPRITIELDTIVNNSRKICLSIISLRAANKVELITNIPIEFLQFKVNEESIKKSEEDYKYVFSIEKGSVMSYYLTSPTEIIDLEFMVDANQKFDLDILEAKFDLFSNPAFKITPRSEIMMPMPFVLNDATVIKTNIKF